MMFIDLYKLLLVLYDFNIFYLTINLTIQNEIKLITIKTRNKLLILSINLFEYKS